MALAASRGASALRSSSCSFAAQLCASPVAGCAHRLRTTPPMGHQREGKPSEAFSQEASDNSLSLHVVKSLFVVSASGHHKARAASVHPGNAADRGRAGASSRYAISVHGPGMSLLLHGRYVGRTAGFQPIAVLRFSRGGERVVMATLRKFFGTVKSAFLLFGTLFSNRIGFEFTMFRLCSVCFCSILFTYPVTYSVPDWHLRTVNTSCTAYPGSCTLP